MKSGADSDWIYGLVSDLSQQVQPFALLHSSHIMPKVAVKDLMLHLLIIILQHYSMDIAVVLRRISLLDDYLHNIFAIKSEF